MEAPSFCYNGDDRITLGSHPRRFIIFPKNGGGGLLCAHWVGGASKYRFVCASAQSIFF